MRRKTCVLAAAVSLTAVAPLSAHPGPRIWVGSADNMLATFLGDNDTNPTQYMPQRVFVGGADPDTLVANGQLDEYPVPGTGIFATDFPAYQVRVDGNAGFGTGRSFGFNLAGPVLTFNDTRQGWRTVNVAFGATQTPPQFSISTGSQQAISGDGFVSGFDFYTYNTPGDHAHLVATLLGDGTSAIDGPHAVYAVPMQLTTGGPAPSPTYYVLYGRAVPLTDPAFQHALDVANGIFPAIPGDANVDGKVNALDYNAVAANFGGMDEIWDQGDFNFDAQVNSLDFAILASHFGKANVNPAAYVPEPASTVLLWATYIGCKRRSKRRARHTLPRFRKSAGGGGTI